MSLKDPDVVIFFFASVMELSEKAKLHIIGRGDDVVLMAETHREAKDTDKFLKLLGSHGWTGTASLAQPSERSESGTVGGDRGSH